MLTLGERDCSIQRKHQKLIEECPSIQIFKKSERKKISDLCIKVPLNQLVMKVLALLEFLYENKNIYFTEMNTRLQVEHPVTEMVTQTDLVKEQISSSFWRKT